MPTFRSDIFIFVHWLIFEHFLNKLHSFSQKLFVLFVAQTCPFLSNPIDFLLILDTSEYFMVISFWFFFAFAFAWILEHFIS